MGDYNGAEKYMDVLQLQQLQDHLTQTVEVTAIILDRNGEALTRQSFNGQAASGRENTENSFWTLGPAVGLREKVESDHTPCWDWLAADTATAVVPMLVDEEYLGCWVFCKKVEVPEGIVDSDLKAKVEQEIRHIIGIMSSWDEMVSRLLLRIKRLERTIRNFDDRNKQLQTFVDASETAMYVCDFHSHELLMVNQAFCRQEGLEADMVLGEKCWKVTHNSKKGVCDFCPKNKLVDKEDNPSGVFVWEHYNQRLGKWMRISNKAIFWNGNRLAHMVTLVDITGERQLRDRLTYTAYYDRHTGLANTQKLLVDLREIQSDLSTESIHLICLQLKSMSQFSRGYGKGNGFGLYTVMGDWIHCIDEGISVYRTDGYGFILLLKNRTLKHCKGLVARIQERYQEAWQLDIEGNQVFHYCSISGSIICLSSAFFHHDINDLVERTLQSAADTKEFIVYDEDIDQQEKQRVEFEISLKNQVRDGMSGFDVHYQPIVDAGSGTWHGIEALCRWTNGHTGKAVSPAVFIPEAERLGLIGDIGEWVLEKSVAMCKELRLDEVDGFFLSVNMSFGQIMDDGFVERVAKILDYYRFPAEKLDLEVTESMEFHFNSHTLATIERFKQLGINLALDDFGTGYSSLNQLKNLPAKYVKTEREFVEDIETDNQRQYFYYMIAELAHMNGMELIAEGIENEEQLALVRKNGADMIQGYYFSKPLSKEQLGDSVMRFNMAQPGNDLATAAKKDLRKWQKSNTIQMAPPQLLRLLNQCIELLLVNYDAQQLVTNILELVGKHFDLSGAFAALFETPSQKSSRCEWVNGIGQGERKHLSKQALVTALPFLKESFSESGVLISSDITMLPPAIFDLLEPTKLRSIMVLPIRRAHEIIGIIGFEDERHRGWDPSELLFLWNLSCLVRGIRENAELCDSGSCKRQLLSKILHSEDVGIMVCDLETSEILWVNETRKYFNISTEYIGKRCYEVFHERQERCAQCQVPNLVEGGPGELMRRNLNNEQTDTAYVIYDGLLRWDAGKLVHIEYLMDGGKRSGL